MTRKFNYHQKENERELGKCQKKQDHGEYYESHDCMDIMIRTVNATYLSGAKMIYVTLLFRKYKKQLDDIPLKG